MRKRRSTDTLCLRKLSLNARAGKLDPKFAKALQSIKKTAVLAMKNARNAAFFVLLAVASVLPLSLQAQPTPVGTVITNIATGILQVATVPAVATSNSVSLVVAAPLPPPPSAPVLTKSFGAASIVSGSSTPLTFTIANSSAVALAGGTFTDNLPAGLRLTAGATATVGGSVGCSATTTLLPTSIAVANLAVPANATCLITVNAVTNQIGQTNLSCVGNPPVFTNALANISGVVGLDNQVSSQCLVVSPVGGLPTLTKYFGTSVLRPGDLTSLSFSISNTAGNPLQTGIGFTDQLPSAVSLVPGASASFSPGCSGTATFPNSSTVTLAGVTINAGTPTCMIQINSISVANTAANPSCGSNPPAYTNAGTSIVGLANLQNQVVPQCLVVAQQSPALTKQFGASAITAGDSTTLTFTLTNVAGNPGQANVAFTDFLPPGLQFLPQSAGYVVGPGCFAIVSFGRPKSVNISSGTMSPGTASCTIRITGVTNTPGAISTTSCASSTPPQDFINDAFSLQSLANADNQVQPQCLTVLTALPSLTKQFADDRIYDGDATSLTLTVQNSTGRPQADAVAFVDTLPIGLRFGPVAAAVIRGAGCTGTVNLVGNQVRVSNLSLAVGTQSCEVIISGITNTVGQLNASCATNPAAFTNQSSSISGLTNVHNFVANACLIVEPSSPALEMTVAKSISAREGYSPGGPHTVSLAFSNAITGAAARKRNVSITDVLPAGMTIVPGSMRVSIGSSSINASNGNGSAVVGTRAVTYASSAGQLQIDFSVLEPGDVGTIVFDVDIAAGLARETILTNIANHVFTNSADRRFNRSSNAVTFRVIGALGVTVTGQTIVGATPGQTLLFQNTITNRGNVTDTYDITLRGATFPEGAIITLLGSDGVTPLADSSRNGVPDTGPVSAGASAIVVVRVVLPAGVVPGGPYRVSKSARSVTDRNLVAADDDVLLAVNRNCQIRLEPDNRARVRAGASVTYSHTLTNVGNCEETIVGSLTGGATGWTGVAALDPASTINGSLSGALTAASPAVSTPVVLAPGQSANYLVVVTAPATARPGDTATHVIAVSSTSTATPGSPAANRVVSNNDVTTVDPNATNLPDDIIRGFIDSEFRRTTLWTFIGRDFFLRASAPSCNAVPDVIERRTIIITGPNGEREEIIAIETGPNTGIFDASIPVRLPPAIPGDLILEGVAYDTFGVEIVGCGRRISTTVTLIDPNGVVFDSRTNAPVVGASVRLVPAQAGVCSSTPAAVQVLDNGAVVNAPNPVVTGSDGRFDFPLVSPGDYCVQVRPPNGYTWTSIVAADQLPAGRNILATGPTTGGSYGGAFRVGPETGPVILDIPVDSGLISGLFIRKEVLRAFVELGEFVDYTVTVNNQTGYALRQSDVIATDDLPAGFTYVRGSARVDGKAIADPAGDSGPRLVFNVGRMDAGKQAKLTYRVRVGPGALQGDGVNRVIAAYRIGATGLYSQSNVATAKVSVSAGVFSDRAYVVGKIFADCNADRLQTRADNSADGEVGIPGVRLYLEDGTNVVTDAEGKYSFYGITPRTHVLKIDRTTLPDGVEVDDLAKRSTRNLGKGDSRILDLKNGEIHKANFAVTGCKPAAMKDIDSRRRAASRVNTEIDGRLQEKLSTDGVTRPLSDVKALPATGTVGQALMPSNANGGANAQTPQAAPANTNAAAGGAIVTPSVKSPTAATEGSTNTAIDAGSVGDGKSSNAATVSPLEEILPGENNALGFIGLKNGDVLAFAQTSIRVKGATGTTFRLMVNGIEVSDSRVGKRAVLEDKQLQAWEYIGVALKAGENELSVTQTDAFGNLRGESKIKLLAPGELAQINIEYGERVRNNGGAAADGKTPVTVTVRMLDKFGTPVTSRLPLTISSNLGRWDVVDVNPVEPGIQVFVEGGVGEFVILPPAEPGQALISVESGRVKRNVPLDFLPDLRDMVASGLIEGIINLRKLDSRAMVPTRQQDAFEKEIVNTVRTWNDGKYQGAARAAMFLKGKIKGEYLLTVAYDSDKDTKERLFRDIQPDEFYPVYGDSSVRAFDAQSTGRLYVRVDHKKSYLLYGDFNTAGGAENRQLSNYNRSLTGIRHHYETAKVQANIFASRDSTKQVVDEFRANGTSGPFTLTNTRGLINSEKLEVLTRDRNQANLILRTLPLIRFADYEIESLTGRILLKAPVASLDENLNPQSLRITYEVDQGGPQFWVAGADAQVKVTDRFEIGAAVVDDRNPTDKFRMMSINSVARIADKSFIIAEIVRTSREKVVVGESSSEVTGNAKRIEFKHKDGSFDGNLFIAKSDAGFDNPNASLAKGRTEAGGKMSYRLDEKTGVKGELLSTQDNVTGAKRDGILLSIERTLAAGLRAEFGMRHARDTQAAPVTGVNGSLGQATKQDVTTVRGRITGEVPGIKNFSAYGEAEFDVQDTQRKILALGGEYQLPNKGRLYARHEFVSSITGPYGLNNQQRQNATVVGINTDYMKDGNLFSEYRVRDAISGGDAEAAIGLRNSWTVAEGLKLQTGFERVHTLAGIGTGESTALTGGLEYTANPLWKGSTRLELREGQSQDSILSTIALASKLNRDWTVLGRNTFSLLKNKGQAKGENKQERLQLGLAYRDTDSDTWNALGRIEHRTESDTTQPDIVLKRSVEMISLHANWQPRRPFTFSARYAAKWVNENSNGLASKNNTQLVAGRAVWEISPRWDVSLNASTLLGRGAAAKQYGLGAELGFMVMENLWLSAGYNWFGYKDQDLTASDYTNKGVFLRLRYKFDEDLFADKSKPVASSPGAVKAPGMSATAPAADAATERTP